MYKGVVLHEMQLKAFLSIAAQEELICEKGISDGVFNSLTKYKPTYTFGKAILEKFCVAGTIYVDPYIYRVLDGKMIEQGLIMPFEPFMEGEIDPLGFQYDLYMIQLMLAEEGYSHENYTIEKIRESLYDLKKQSREIAALMETYPDVKRLSLTKVLGLNDPIYKSEYIDRYSSLKESITSNPVFRVLVEYNKNVSVAYHNDLLSSCTIEIDNKANDELQFLKNTDRAVRISKYTSEKIGCIYTAASLNECISLIQSAPAQAYRQKVDEFLNALSKSDYDQMEVIDQEIEKAINATKWSKAIKTAGKVVATAGAIGTTASLIRPDSLAAMGISCAATFIGVPLAFLDPNKQYLWASYGIVNR